MRHETTGKDGDWKRVRGDKDVVKVKYDNTGIDFAANKECFGIGPGYFKLRNVATASLPASPDEGAFVYDSTLKAPVFYNGTDYKTLSAFGSEVALTDIEDIASDRLLGRDTAGSGAVEQLTVGAGLEFTGSGGIGIADYSTGTWTPVLTDASFNESEGQAYLIQLGKYVRYGDMVHFTGILSMSSVGTLSGAAHVGGLPFASSNDSIGGGVSVSRGTQLSITAGVALTGTIDANEDTIALGAWDATTGTSALQISEITDDGGLVFRGMYFV